MTSADPPRRLQVVIAFALVYVLWGSTYLAIRVAVEHLTPLMMGALRFTTAGLLMLGYRALCGHRIRVARRDLLRLGIVGILLLITSNVVLGWAETYIPTGLAALFTAAIPLWFLILERISNSNERLSRRGICGIALGVIGVAILLWPEISNHANIGGWQLFGSALAIVSSVSWAIGSILARRWHMPIDAFAASGWHMLIAGVVSGLIALLFGDLHRTTWAGSSLWAVVYLVIAGSLVGYTAYVWLLKNVPIAKVSTYAYVIPVVALIFGWLLHGEKMDGYMLAGAVVVIPSVILVTGAKIKREAGSGRPMQEEALDLEPLEPNGD
ncbi:MAG: EamA family transporter [Candidatus Korobacteraceae bacterium]|jgi:drug/metabolite transporter (DMT)-like permease